MLERLELSHVRDFIREFNHGVLRGMLIQLPPSFDLLCGELNPVPLHPADSPADQRRADEVRLLALVDAHAVTGSYSVTRDIAKPSAFSFLAWRSAGREDVLEVLIEARPDLAEAKIQDTDPELGEFLLGLAVAERREFLLLGLLFHR